MPRRNVILGATFIVLFAVLMLGMYVLPLQRREGIIDVTQTTCVNMPVAVKRYHLLFGQKQDYILVTKHLKPLTNVPCGQHGDFRLYL